MARDETRDTSRVMSYDELAATLGISRESARRHVLRKRWVRRKGNDGKVRIEVPADGLPVAGHDTGHVLGHVTEHVTGHDAGPSQALFRIIERLEGEIAELRPKVAEREVLAVRVENLTVTLEAEKRRADELYADRDRMRARTDHLEGELAELRPKALERDVFAAMLEQTRIERDAERQKAAEHDVLAVQLDTLKVALEESRRERDRWATQAHALAHPPSPPVPSVATRRGFLGWFRRAG